MSFCLLTCPVLTSIPFHLLLAEAVLLPPAGQHSHSSTPPLHPCGNGPGSDGAQSVQREVDGAPGGCQVDRDDQVRLNVSEHSYLGQNLAMFDRVVNGTPTKIWVEKC